MAQLKEQPWCDMVKQENVAGAKKSKSKSKSKKRVTFAPDESLEEAMFIPPTPRVMSKPPRPPTHRPYPAPAARQPAPFMYMLLPVTFRSFLTDLCGLKQFYKHWRWPGWTSSLQIESSSG